MSVQVRRRREAAAFLQSFVGAQGELLVDTTNNRVQVHDGVAPGGWPAAGIGDLPGRNALINGNFAINQRVYASGGSLAAGAYAHDRWKAGTAGAYTFSQASPDTTITITSGTLVQAVDTGNVYAASMWLTWAGTATARVWQGSAAGAFSAGTSVKVGGVTVNALLVTGLAIGTIAAVEFSTGTLGLVQFEAALPNAGPTRFERRHGELVLCLRYFQKLTGAAYRSFGSGIALATSTTAAASPQGLLSPMRAVPTFAWGGTISLYNAGFIKITNIVADQPDTLSTNLNLYVSSSTPLNSGGLYQFIAQNDTTAFLSFTAEI